MDGKWKNLTRERLQKGKEERGRVEGRVKLHFIEKEETIWWSKIPVLAL